MNFYIPKSFYQKKFKYSNPVKSQTSSFRKQNCKFKQKFDKKKLHSENPSQFFFRK